MKRPEDSFSEFDRKKLKDSIFSSISKYRRRKRIINYSSIAASFLILSISYFLILDRQQPWFKDALSEYNDISLSDGNVTLYLKESDKIVVERDSVSIAYTSNGNQINIDGDQSLTRSSVDPEVSYNTLVVPYGKRSKLSLADGTTVIINSGSKIIYPNQFIGNTREVYLEGEAIFDVNEDPEHPFIVRAENHSVRVLGTVFNVANYPDESTIRTILKSGKVAITYKGNNFLNSEESIEILPGMLASYDRNSSDIETEKINVEPYFSWQEGVFIFKNDSLDEIMKKLSRYYGNEIIITNENLRKETFSGYLDLKESVERVLENIREITAFSYVKTDTNKIIIN